MLPLFTSENSEEKNAMAKDSNMKQHCIMYITIYNIMELNGGRGGKFPTLRFVEHFGSE